MPRLKRPFWVAEQLETALFDGLAPLIRRALNRHGVAVEAFAIWFTVGLVGAGGYFASPVVDMVAGVILYLATVQVWPWKPCHACEGNPRHRDWGTPRTSRTVARARELR